jgi:hypothetical protein
MKIWYGYGSEHSANLVLIGRFVSSADATAARRAITQLEQQVRSDLDAGLLELDNDSHRFTDGMLELLQELRLYSVSPSDVEQFAYDYRVEAQDEELVVATDEIDVSAFVKLMIDRRAKVEIYSAHDYETDGSPKARA